MSIVKEEIKNIRTEFSSIQKLEIKQMIKYKQRTQELKISEESVFKKEVLFN